MDELDPNATAALQVETARIMDEVHALLDAEAARLLGQSPAAPDATESVIEVPAAAPLVLVGIAMEDGSALWFEDGGRQTGMGRAITPGFIVRYGGRLFRVEEAVTSLRLSPYPDEDDAESRESSRPLDAGALTAVKISDWEALYGSDFYSSRM